ncbi:MAG: NADP-dependent malic enzyme [Candidatus Aenigmarchaeota archaeon]|nr:NADP-dependent malic enzyme [Candidatus Aenigmarchaeota archaeon]
MADDIYKRSLKMHEKNGGKLEVCSKVGISNADDLSMAYTPGVAEVCREIVKDKNLAYKYTLKKNTVAIVTDGSAVLGLGNIGGYAAIPVMEGKAVLFKKFAGIDAFPICFESYHTDFIEDVKNISPVFGAINLEDIAAPKCFEVEEKLQDIGIPVMHDDQHGTAVVVLAALLNAATVVNKKPEEMSVVISGAGAAGTAIARMLVNVVGDVIVCDRKGTIYEGREDLKEKKYKKMLSEITNRKKLRGTLADAMKGTDVFIGVSAPNIVTEEMVRSMADKPIVFSMANPVPEIMPDKAKKAGAAVVATGRSDFPNQVNNAVAFPGIFRGALDARATKINDEMKLAAAYALASIVRKPSADRIIPSILEDGVSDVVASAVAGAAEKCGCIRD